MGNVLLDKFISELSIIIPAAGLGTRVGSPAAKELLLHPVTGRTFIDECLIKLQDIPAKKYIITRENKEELIKYVNAKQIECFLQQNQEYRRCEIVKILESKEWPDTVLKSKDHWSTWNLLILPDADYSPLSAPKEIIELAYNNQSDCKIIFATIPVTDISKWGIIQLSENELLIADKPQSLLSNNQRGKAWGIILFHKSVGIELFSKILESNLLDRSPPNSNIKPEKDINENSLNAEKWKKIKVKALEYSLLDFVDQTR